MKILNNIRKGLSDVSVIIHNEFRTIFTSFAILLVLIGGIFVYGLLYNYMYAPDVVRNAPVAIVDYSKSELSRQFIRYLNTTPQIEVVTDGVDYSEAQVLMKNNEAVGIIYIPEDFEDRVSRGEQSIFIAYETTSAFLYYMSMQEASSAAMLALNENYRPNMIVFLPSGSATQLASAQPVTVVGTALYNFTEGYGTYLIPAVLIVIIFQTLLMLIGMISGKERETGSIACYATEGISFGRVSRIIAAKTFVYLVLYAVFCLFLLGFITLLFDMPDLGNPFYVIALLVPFILATSFWGLGLFVFFTDSEAPLLFIAFFSVGFIFLSGVSYPMELMPWYWKVAHYIVPAPPATLGYVQLSSMGASLEQIRMDYITLWIQCIVYFVFACLSYQYQIRKAAYQKIKTQ
ncbi:ABC transporter permease [Parabacteroides bouchesdurhonensis]|uniref:ABC transporter permease n=1 Tax=Parabacteroides bouchesdurhonensis TaxID=1936995 RepID=UPI000C849B96|nr:ABC transporter permease [Parabacteroides bouchesdurhonensis]